MSQLDPAVGREVEQLFAVLNAYHLPPEKMEAGFTEFSRESKNELVARIARTPDPAPEGRLLARLLYVRTAENQNDMATAFIANLHSPSPEARAASLHGLQQLAHPSVVDFALAMVHDDSDLVLMTACQILVPRSEQDPNILKTLRELYATHEGVERFHMSLSYLKAHSIG